MKHFICKILLYFILPIGILLITQEMALRSIPNDYKYKNQWLTENAKSIQVLSLGSSHAFFGIQPTAFSRKAFNAAHVSQSLEFDAFIFDKFIDSMDSLEVVVLPISYFTLRSKGLQSGLESWRVKNYTIYYECPYYRYKPSLALECYHIAPKATLQAIFTHVNHRSCDSLGRGTDYVLESRSDDWMDAGPGAMKRHTKIENNIEVVNKNIGYINHIISKCAQKGVYVILLTTPTYHTYYDVLNQEQLDQMVKICQELADNYKNTLYLNWLKHIDFEDDDYFDADHLNEFGAAKLSKMLDGEINKLQQSRHSQSISVVHR